MGESFNQVPQPSEEQMANAERVKKDFIHSIGILEQENNEHLQKLADELKELNEQQVTDLYGYMGGTLRDLLGDRVDIVLAKEALNEFFSTNEQQARMAAVKKLKSSVKGS